ncbi:MAG: GntR family transcriptional regulator [Clostridia bacterium]|nr:GntR family transcriptional regulator [Clostridia bacterium]
MAAKSLSERTADALYDMIMTEKAFLPGDKLPNENELSDRLGVSRATLREAIRSLVAQGILRVHRGKGTFITDNVYESAFGFDQLDRARVRLKDLYEMRLIFEPQCIAFACVRASDEEIEHICRQGNKVIREIETQDANWPESDQRFHMLISKASHNEFIIQLFPIINSAVHETMEIANNQKVLEDLTISDNRLIMEFLTRRDAKGASCALNLHMRHTINALGLDKN